jgi:hypothetical protein
MIDEVCICFGPSWAVASCVLAKENNNENLTYKVGKLFDINHSTYKDVTRAGTLKIPLKILKEG